MATAIPGLSFIGGGADEFAEELATFDLKKFKIPESHRYGNCDRSDNFEKISKISEGSFASYYKVSDKRDGKIYALKKFTYPEDMQNDAVPVSMLREINILRLLKHENIVKFHGMVVGKDFQSANYILLDYGVISLKDLIGKTDKVFEQSVVKYIMQQLFSGLAYMHRCTVVHRNISTNSILFTADGTLKIGGFRTVRFCGRNAMSPTKTEVRFRAPELLLKAKYDYPADIWSAGCVYGELLLKRPLFTGDSELAVLISIFNVIGTPSETIWPGFDMILKKGTLEEKKIVDPIPYSELNDMLADVPYVCSQLLSDILIYNPSARIPASVIMKSPYMDKELVLACSSNKMKKIIDDVFYNSVASIEVDDD